MTSLTRLTAHRRHPAAAFVVLLLGLMTTGGVYAALTRGDDTAEASAGTSIAVEEGRKLYLEGCSSCHGRNAEGTSDGPSLVGVGAAAVDFQVGTGRMPASQPGAQVPRKDPQYTQAEIDQLGAYIASLGPGPSVPSEEDLDYEDADLVEGGELFRTNCASCHNFSGQGGALTDGKYAPSLEGSSAKHMYEAMLTGPQSMPVFSDDVLEPEQKRSIIKFVKATEEEPNPGGLSLGRLGPVTEGLFVWVVGIGALVGAAVWLGAKSS